MLLYKFKSSSSLLYLLDILVHERLFCSPYAQLNDPFEGQFKTLAKSYQDHIDQMPHSLGKLVLQAAEDELRPPPRYRALAEFPAVAETRVCSLTSSYREVRMWSLYADSHYGIAVEIDFEGLEGHLHEVKHVPSLPKVRQLDDLRATDVLTFKTVDWTYEAEYRLIQASETFDIRGRVRRVMLGTRASPALQELLLKLMPRGAQIVRMRLDHDGAQVEIGQEIERAV